jgi:hypothetical protein
VEKWTVTGRTQPESELFHSSRTTFMVKVWEQFDNVRIRKILGCVFRTGSPTPLFQGRNDEALKSPV